MTNFDDFLAEQLEDPEFRKAYIDELTQEQFLAYEERDEAIARARLAEAGSEFDEGGLPKHLAMGVTADGQGPENDDTAHHFVCWCKDSDCDWNIALAHNTRKAKASMMLDIDHDAMLEYLVEQGVLKKRREVFNGYHNGYTKTWLETEPVEVGWTDDGGMD